MTPLVPHISMPFRFNPDGTVPVVEQDSDEEIWDCVRTVVRTAKGSRLEDPDLGVIPLEFQEQPVDASQVESSVTDAEPRAITLISEFPDEFQALVDHVVITEGSTDGD